MFLPSDNLLMLLITESVNLTSHKKLNRKHFLLFQTFEEIKSLHLVTASTLGWISSLQNINCCPAERRAEEREKPGRIKFILLEINQFSTSSPVGCLKAKSKARPACLWLNTIRYQSKIGIRIFREQTL